MDLRDPSGTEWLANVWRPERARRIAVRPGFGQLTQQDCTAERSALEASFATDPATGGYLRHMGSYLYNTNFGHRQIISVFEGLVQYSNADAPTTTSGLTSLETVHGVAKTAVVSIYDLTTGIQWEELLVVHTSENCTNEQMPFAHGHFETSGNIAALVAHDFIKFSLSPSHRSSLIFPDR